MARGSKGAVADIAAIVLAAQKPPKALHYKELTRLAIEAGWVHEGRTDPNIILYESLLDKTREGDTRFVVHGRGYYSLREHNISDEDALPQSASSRDGKSRSGSRKKKEPTLEMLCGNCTSLKFNGIKEVTLEGGICMKDGSKRCGVRADDVGCILWEQRTYGQRQTDAREAARLGELLDDLRRGRSSQGKTKRAMREAEASVEDD